MFQVTRNGENRIDVDFAGKLDSIEMRMALDQLTQHAEGIEHGLGELDHSGLFVELASRNAMQ